MWVQDLWVLIDFVIFTIKIVKQEWPLHWPSFIDDIVGASKTGESLCANNMAILKLLR